MLDFKKNLRCPVCGEKLTFREEAANTRCLFCDDAFYTNGVCANGHYVCDDCRVAEALERIVAGCLESKSDDALTLAYELLVNRWIAIHGPEHHFLTAAALLTAYYRRNRRPPAREQDLAEALGEAKTRASKVADGACGFWGCCGAAVAAGIFASLVLHATPTSADARGAANLMTSKTLERIAANGGPRCCKRETFTALFAASGFAAEYWGKPLTDYHGVECHFFHQNETCAAEECLFHPLYNRNILSE